MIMTKIIKCPDCNSPHMRNVYKSRVYEYISITQSNDLEFLYQNCRNKFLRSECVDCGAIFSDNAETFIQDVEE